MRAGPAGRAARDVRAERQDEREEHAGGHDRVHRLRVEVVLVDDARNRDDEAQEPGDDRQPARLRRDGEQDGDRDQCRREVQLDECPREAALEAGAADVVELVCRKPRVRDQRQQKVDRHEQPDLHHDAPSGHAAHRFTVRFWP